MKPRVSDSASDWFLTENERGNPDTRVATWTEGNRVAPLVHGSVYFAALATALADTADGDLVLFTDWRGDPEQLLNDDGVTVVSALTGASHRGAVVRGLLWRSHLDALGYSGSKNRGVAMPVEDAGGEAVLDHRVLTFGSHHQKFVVVRFADSQKTDVAFVGGLDLALARRDDADHQGDRLTRSFPEEYGDHPGWHDTQLRIEGPAVADVEDVFRERWEDPAAPSRLPWHVIPAWIHGERREPSELPAKNPTPEALGTCAIQLLRTYPRRRPAYPFATRGERSVARGYAKALRRAQRLVYVEDQYMWSIQVARVFADALKNSPNLRIIVVVPRHLDDDGPITLPSALLGHSEALHIIRRAGGDRVLVVDPENNSGVPIYVHSKVCIIDDVWATVGSDNFNRRSWTHDSELTAAVIDERRDPRTPTDPAGLGDGARVFARDLRLELMREHLELTSDHDDDLLDPETCFRTVSESADRLDAWHREPSASPRPAGRLRNHDIDVPPKWKQWLAVLPYRTFVDPDGRPIKMRIRRKY